MNNSIFTKIKNFFRNIFNKQKRLTAAEVIETTKEVTQDAPMSLNKEQFLSLYEKLKKGDVDIFSIDPDEVEKMCMLLDEEIKIKQNKLNMKLAEINKLDSQIAELNNSI